MYPFIGIYNQKENIWGQDSMVCREGMNSALCDNIKNVLEIDNAERNEQKIETPVKMK